MSNYLELKQQADELFVKQDYENASVKYGEALAVATNEEDVVACNLQIEACKSDEKLPAGQKQKRKRKNPFNFNLGQELISMAAKKLMPKLKPMILKNKPKAIAFMEGKITLKGDPVEGDPQPRRILIELKPSPDGDPEKTDVLVQVLKANMSKIQIAQDNEGNSLAHESVYSATEFINTILNINLDEVTKELQKEAKEKNWLD